MDQQKSHPAYTLCEVAQHQSAKSLWIVIKGKVHDVTKLQDDHPGGADVLKDVAGGDGTEAFEYAGHSNEAVRKLDKLAIGVLTNSKISDNFITHTTHLTGGTEIGQPRLAGRLGRHSVTLAVFSMVCTTSLLYLGFNGAKPSSELAEGVTLEMGPEETGMYVPVWARITMLALSVSLLAILACRWVFQSLPRQKDVWEYPPYFPTGENDRE